MAKTGDGTSRVEDVLLVRCEVRLSMLADEPLGADQDERVVERRPVAFDEADDRVRRGCLRLRDQRVDARSGHGLGDARSLGAAREARPRQAQLRKHDQIAPGRRGTGDPGEHRGAVGSNVEVGRIGLHDHRVHQHRRRLNGEREADLIVVAAVGGAAHAPGGQHDLVRLAVGEVRVRSAPPRPLRRSSRRPCRSAPRPAPREARPACRASARP